MSPLGPRIATRNFHKCSDVAHSKRCAEAIGAPPGRLLFLVGALSQRRPCHRLLGGAALRALQLLGCLGAYGLAGLFVLSHTLCSSRFAVSSAAGAYARCKLRRIGDFLQPTHHPLSSLATPVTLGNVTPPRDLRTQLPNEEPR